MPEENSPLRSTNASGSRTVFLLAERQDLGASDAGDDNPTGNTQSHNDSEHATAQYGDDQDREE